MKTLAWAIGFAVVVALAIAGGHIVTKKIEEWGDSGRLARHGLTTVGTVIAERSSSGGAAGMPDVVEVEISFTTPDGKRHDFWDKGRASIGAEVIVRYDPENPDNASVNSEDDDKVSIVGGVVGGLILLVGAPGVFLKFAWAEYRRAAKA
ncbi:DUF3592 domain-containing protein [Spirillospora sp. NBC_00431]